MSSVNPEVSFAFWVDPATSLKITYSLPLFNEIDFQVNEGYRRIPHGGVEVGGLLYGKIESNAIRIEASRPIDCEHASGPSFHLSERDLTQLKESILTAPKEEELQGLEPVGWFIAHTRGPLQMTEREVELFSRFFPEAKRVTVLVKPERFKPTRFAFLVRGAKGLVTTDGEATAVILPLPGRAGKAPAPAPAIPAPQSSNSKSVAPTPIDSRSKAEAPTPNPAVSSPAAVVQEAVQTTKLSPAAVPSAITETQTGQPVTAGPTGRPVRARPQPGSNWTWRMALVLILAGLLGCGAGYWAYLQIPPPIISLRVQRESKILLVVWDPAQTQSSRYAVIRINNGLPTLLTADQKAAGIAQVPLSGESVKIEIIAQHWARESRGIIRFVPLKAPAEASVESPHAGEPQ